MMSDCRSNRSGHWLSRDDRSGNFYIIAGLHPQLIINPVAVEVFRQGSAVVINKHVVSVLNEFRVFLAADNLSLHSSAECIISIANRLLARGGDR